MGRTFPTVRQLWRALAPETRARAAGELAELKGTPEWPPMDAEIARALNFRPAKVRSASAEEAARWLPTAMLRMRPGPLAELLVALHMRCRSELLAELYDAAGVDHSEGEPSEEASREPLPLEPCLEALPSLIDRHGLEDVRLLAHMLRLRGYPAWLETAGALCARVEESRGLRVDDEEAPRGEEEPAAEASGDEEALRTIPGFTTLDRSLIRAIVSSLNRVEGSLSLDELDDLVGEVVELNESRERSHFFVGYLDALLERDLRPLQPGDNDNRRAWYLAGHLWGVQRGGSSGAAVESLDRLDAKDRERLRTAPCEAGSLVAGELIPALLEAGRVDDAVEWIDDRFPVVARLALPSILSWSRREVVSGSPEAVRRLLESIDRRLGQEERGAATAGEAWVPEALRRDVRRRLATALRRTGHAEESRRIVEGLLADCDDDLERAGLASDRILLLLGLRSFEGIDLGSPETREALVAAIERHRVEIEEAADRPVHTPIPPLALALPAVLGPGDDGDRQAALDRLARALDCMRDVSFWRRTGVLQWIQLAQSVLELRSLRKDRAPEAANRLAGVLEDTALEPPLDLVGDALEHLALTDAPGGGRVAHLALERWPELLRSIDVENLARRNAELRRGVRDALRHSETLAGGERWRAWSDLLTASMGASPRDLGAAREALDELETLALDGHEQRLLELLEERSNWDPAWSRAERDEAEIRLLEATGALDQAAAELTNLIHRAITAGDDAEDLLDKLRTLPHDPEQLENLERRLAAPEDADEEPDEEPEPETLPPVRVLFVGGNETQIAYRDRLQQWLAEAHPGCTVDFEFTGWTSNWGHIVDGLQSRLGKADVLILMRFVRTLLGRALRREADRHEIPWVSCSGHGRESLKRSIEKAIGVARRKG